VESLAKQHLVEVLLAHCDGGRAAAQSLSTANQWPDAVLLAQNWRVTPQLVARIRHLNVEIPQREWALLRRIYLQASGASSQCASNAISAIGYLDSIGIPAAAFKGVASMALLYGGPRDRTIHDADIVVPKERFADAIRCLATHGFTRKGEETIEEYSDFVANAPGFAGNKAISIYSQDGYEIDMHWELSGLGVDTHGILHRARKECLLGRTIPVVDYVDGLLLTVHHAIRENLAIDSIARDLLDIRLWCERLLEHGRLSEATQRIVETGYEVSALAVTGLLQDYDSESAAAMFADDLRRRVSPAVGRSAGRLQKLFHLQLRQGVINKDVFYLVHSRPWQQIARGLAANWSGYRKSLDTVEQQVGKPIALHARLMNLARSVPGIGTLRMARELARIKYGFRRTNE